MSVIKVDLHSTMKDVHHIPFHPAVDVVDFYLQNNMLLTTNSYMIWIKVLVDFTLSNVHASIEFYIINFIK